MKKAIKELIEKENLSIWLKGNMPTYGGYRCSKCGYQTIEYKLGRCPNCKSKMYVKYVGYKYNK